MSSRAIAKSILSFVLFSTLIAVVGCGALGFGGSALSSPTPTVIPTRIYPTVISENTDPTTNVAQAQARLASEGLKFDVIVVSPKSEGVLGDIYQDLAQRNFRATSGPDEGFVTSMLACYPNCVFIRSDAVNALSVEGWTRVLRHEQRHMVQAANNPNMALDFRGADGRFTTYAAFEEACADDGILVAESSYHSSVRMPRLSFILGASNTQTLVRACQGNPSAYMTIVNLYDSKAGGQGAFAALFPPYN